jgi:hypothetical protein
VEEGPLTELAFDIPYIFHIRGIPKRGTKERTEFAFETIQARVRVVASDEAPIAAVFPATLGNKGFLGEAGQVTLRQLADRVYAKALTEHYKETLGVSPDMLSAFLERGVHAVENSDRLSTVLPDAPGVIHRGLFPDRQADYNPIRKFNEDKWQSWSSRDRTEKRTKAELLYGELVVIDGQFWRAAPEPIYVLSRFNDAFASIMPITEAGKHDKESIFGLTSWERMAARSVDRWGTAPDESNRATIFMEDAFAYDDTTELVVDSIARATDHDGDLLKSFDVESMSRWAAMRDALALARSMELAPATLDSLAAAAEHYAIGPRSSSFARGLIEKALEAHDGHSVEIPLGHSRRP